MTNAEIVWASFFGFTLVYLCSIIQQLKEKVHHMTTTLADQITALTAAVAQETSVNQSAIALINGIPALIAQAAQNAGASPDVLAALQSATDSITANASQLGSAVTANTPAAPPAPAPAPAPDAPATPTT